MSRDPRELGGSLLGLLALLAAIAITGAISARLLLTHRHAARETHLRAVARTLAEGGIEAARAALRRGAGVPPRPLTGAAIGERHVGSVVVASQPVPGGARDITATATVRPAGGGAPVAACRVSARLARREGRVVALMWSESPRRAPAAARRSD